MGTVTATRAWPRAGPPGASAGGGSPDPGAAVQVHRRARDLTADRRDDVDRPAAAGVDRDAHVAAQAARRPVRRRSQQALRDAVAHLLRVGEHPLEAQEPQRSREQAAGGD